MFFNNFPKITYNGVTARNILLKSALVSEVFSSADAFYPYIVREGYRPDTVSNKVYNTPFLDWLVYYSNVIVDPYYEWPLDSADFKAFLEKKYGDTMYSLMNTIHHYKYTGVTNETAQDIARKSWNMSVDTHDRMVGYGEDTSGWTPVSVYDYEDALNESRRSIKILSDRYVSQVTAEISRVLNQ